MNPFEENDFRIKTLEEKLEQIEKRINLFDSQKEIYEVFFTPTVIIKYIESSIGKKIPSKWKTTFATYFSSIKSDYDYGSIIYDSSLSREDIEKVALMVSYQGRSGLSYLDNIDNVSLLNKPILLYYGIMQISSYYANLFYNFTDLNRKLDRVSKEIRRHGISANELIQIREHHTIEDIIEKKITLLKSGMNSRFFLAYSPEMVSYFLNQVKFSLLSLLKCFFSPNNQFLNEEIHWKFANHYGYHPSKIQDQGWLVFIIYTISFLLSYLARYKMFYWVKLLESTENNLNFFIKYFLTHAKPFFLNLIFKDLSSQEPKKYEMI